MTKDSYLFKHETNALNLKNLDMPVLIWALGHLGSHRTSPLQDTIGSFVSVASVYWITSLGGSMQAAGPAP